MKKPTPNPPENEDTSPYTNFDSKTLHPAAERALDFHFPNNREETKKRVATLFSVSPDFDTLALLANASEDLLGISSIAASLADSVEGPNRSIALTLNRMAEGVYLLVDRAMDHLDVPEMADFFAKQKKQTADA